MGAAVRAATVVPPGWVAHHRPIIVGVMESAGTVRLERVTGHTTDSLGTRHDVWTVVYEGPAQIVLPAKAGAERDSAGTPVTVAPYFARMPIGVFPRIGDRLTSVSSRDERLPGLLFTIMEWESQDLAVDRTVQLKRVN